MVWADNPERFANSPIFMQTCLSSRRQGSYRFEHTLSQALSSRSADPKLRRQCIQPAGDADEWLDDPAELTCRPPARPAVWSADWRGRWSNRLLRLSSFVSFPAWCVDRMACACLMPTLGC